MTTQTKASHTPGPTNKRKAVVALELEMIVALKKCCDYLETYCLENNSDQMTEQAQEVFDKARAAVAKAEGGKL